MSRKILFFKSEILKVESLMSCHEEMSSRIKGNGRKHGLIQRAGPPRRQRMNETKAKNSTLAIT